MSNDQSIFYTNDKHGKTQARFLNFTFNITAAKTVSVFPRGCEVLSTFDALTQPVIDAYLGTTSEFTAAQFDATAMGTDAFGGLINMTGFSTPQGTGAFSYPAGQAASVVSLNVSLKSGTNFATIVQSNAFGPTGLTASTLAAGCAVGANGNIAFRSVLTGLDVLTSGIITVTVGWIAA
jgi:hypothetical protein